MAVEATCGLYSNQHSKLCHLPFFVSISFCFFTLLFEINKATGIFYRKFYDGGKIVAKF